MIQYANEFFFRLKVIIIFNFFLALLIFILFENGSILDHHETHERMNILVNHPKFIKVHEKERKLKLVLDPNGSSN